MITATIEFVCRCERLGCGELPNGRLCSIGYRDDRPDDVAAEIGGLIDLLKKYQDDNTSESTDKDLATDVDLGRMLIKALTLTEGAIPIGTDTLNRMQKVNLRQAVYLLHVILSENFPVAYARSKAVRENDD